MPPELTPNPVEQWTYRLLSKVGKGASGSVWSARHASGAPVALKIGHSAAERARFAREATSLMLAGSTSLPALLEIGLLPAAGRADLDLPQGVPFLALEWLEGGALDATALLDSGRLDIAMIVARDVALAIADLHAAGLAHGDVKPHNVLFDSSSMRARPIDLGLCDAVSERRVQGATPRYLAPECRVPGADSDAGARDLWALGITLAEIADARVAASHDPAEQARTCRFDPRLESLIRPLLRASAGGRPAADWVYRQAARVLGVTSPPTCGAHEPARVCAVHT